MAAPVWVSSTTVAGGTAASCVLTLPASIAANDLVVVQLYRETTAAITPASGFTQYTTVATTALGIHQQAILWKRMSGGESGTVTFSWTGSVWRAGHAHRITGGITSGDPWNASNTAFRDTAGLTTPAVSLTGTVTDSLLFWGATDHSGSTASITGPSGFTQRAFDAVLWSATKDNTAGGNTGSLTATANAGSHTMTAFVGTLMGAAAAPTTQILMMPARSA